MTRVCPHSVVKCTVNCGELVKKACVSVHFDVAAKQGCDVRCALGFSVRDRGPRTQSDREVRTQRGNWAVVRPIQCRVRSIFSRSTTRLGRRCRKRQFRRSRCSRNPAPCGQGGRRPPRCLQDISRLVLGGLLLCRGLAHYEVDTLESRVQLDPRISPVHPTSLHVRRLPPRQSSGGPEQVAAATRAEACSVRAWRSALGAESHFFG